MPSKAKEASFLMDLSDASTPSASLSRPKSQVHDFKRGGRKAILVKNTQAVKPQV